MKLNPEKRTFGLLPESFLGCLVTRRGIEADPDQISSILNMKSPTCVKDMQMLNECITFSLLFFFLFDFS